jgi:GNAT superfamily N-acetyltransferase/RimJ/RimL family protein N-acetyltransferase
MDLQRFAADRDSEPVRACHEIYLSGMPADDPHVPPLSLRDFTGWLVLGWTEDPSETWLARDSTGRPCGWYLLTLPRRENQHHADLSAVVHASRRRAGLGTALLRHAAGRADRRGRSLLTAEAREGSPGAAFAAALGARRAAGSSRRVLDLTAVPAGHLATLRARAEPAARGYSLLSWAGPVPGDWIAAVAAINVAMADAPRDAGHEAQLWDAERVRQDDHRRAVQGWRSYVVAVRSLVTGELAGLTQVSVDPAYPAWGLQELTAVAGPHRGHRLGLLVKVAMLELLAGREPQLTRIVTGNADGNEHMIAINDELGYTLLDRWPSWEMEVARAPAHPAPAVAPSPDGG